MNDKKFGFSIPLHADFVNLFMFYLLVVFVVFQHRSYVVDVKNLYLLIFYDI